MNEPRHRLSTQENIEIGQAFNLSVELLKIIKPSDKKEHLLDQLPLITTEVHHILKDYKDKYAQGLINKAQGYGDTKPERVKELQKMAEDIVDKKKALKGL